MQGNHNPLSNNLVQVLKFLTFLHSSGKSYNTINIYRSMLSMTLPPIDGSPLGKNPLIIRLMKGCYNSHPPLPRYVHTWDLNILLNFMQMQEDQDQHQLALLSKKLASLLAISTWLRTAELASISKQSISITNDRAVFSLDVPRKSQFKGPLKSFTVSRFSDPKTCPVHNLGNYLVLTDYLRNQGNSDKLFIGLVHPNVPVTGNTIGRWIKSYLQMAGIDTSIYSAHSTRSAAASDAARSGVPIEIILKTGNWRNESTFSKFYKKNISTE